MLWFLIHLNPRVRRVLLSHLADACKHFQAGLTRTPLTQKMRATAPHSAKHFPGRASYELLGPAVDDGRPSTVFASLKGCRGDSSEGG